MTVLDRLSACKLKMDMINTSINNSNVTMHTLEDQINSTKSSLGNIIEYKQFYRKAIDIVYERSIQELKDVINTALNYIFTDKNLEVDIELTDKRGKSLTFVIKHNNKRVNLRRGTGMGVKCVISCILQMYYLQCKNSRKLLLDEAYSNISKEYVERFFEFLEKMCQKLDFTVILITHDERFIEYADTVYEINNGVVKLIKREKS